jgi:hypothetical protein
MADVNQIAKWKAMIAEYEAWYQDQYNRRPGEKCMQSFCKINGIPQPLPYPDDEFDFLQ